MEPHQHHQQHSTRYSSSLPTASHCGGMFPVWNVHSSGRQVLDMACTIWKVMLCRKQTEDAKKQNALCQRIYISTWILGLTFGTVATVLSFTEGDNNQASSICLWVSIVGSFLAGLGHFYVLTKKSFCSRKMWILIRFVTSVVGVVLVLCLTVTGTLISKNLSVVFEMCGVASVLCYFSVGIALSKRLFWECQRDFADVRSRRVGRRNARQTASRPIPNSSAENNNMFIIYNECGGQIEIVRTPRRGSLSNNSSRNFTVSNNYSGYSHNHNDRGANIWNMSCISLPVLSIPSYDDIMADSEHAASFQPPKYTEYDGTTVSATEMELSTLYHSGENVTSSDENLPGGQLQFSDLPPRYTEHVSDVIPVGATETHNTENGNV